MIGKADFVQIITIFVFCLYFKVVDTLQTHYTVQPQTTHLQATVFNVG